jgi:hypothetical protein
MFPQRSWKWTAARGAAAGSSFPVQWANSIKTAWFSCESKGLLRGALHLCILLGIRSKLAHISYRNPHGWVFPVFVESI